MTINAPQHAMTRTISAKDNIQDLITGGEVFMANASTDSTLCEMHVHAPRSEGSRKQKQEKKPPSNRLGDGKPLDCSNDVCYCNYGGRGAFITGVDEPTGKLLKMVL